MPEYLVQEYLSGFINEPQEIDILPFEKFEIKISSATVHEVCFGCRN